MVCGHDRRLGLTGLITWAGIEVRPICSSLIAMESIKLAISTIFSRSRKESESGLRVHGLWQTVSRRGVHWEGDLYAGQSCERGGARSLDPSRPALAYPSISVDCPESPLRLRHSIRLLCPPAASADESGRPLQPIFLPPGFNQSLESHLWRAWFFFQYQFVVPFSADSRAIRAILKEICVSGPGLVPGRAKDFSATSGRRVCLASRCRA